VVTSNSVNTYCHQALSLADGSSGVTVENNVFISSQSSTACAGLAAPFANVLVADATSAAGTTADFNLVHDADGGADYDWNGVTYPSPAAFTAATGQGAHDVDATTVAAETDAANSDAPGELSTDLMGHPRVDDPLVANTGVGTYSYYDLGAVELQEPLQVPFKQSAGRAPVGGVVTFSVPVVDAWASSFTYVFDVGDGTGTVTNTTGTATHAYAATGVYTPTVQVTSSFGGSATAKASPITVVTPAPLTPGYSYGSDGGLLMNIDWFDHTTGGWNPISATIDYGDGSAPFTTTGTSTGFDMQANDIHKYAKPGTYPFTLTVTDAGGDTARTTGSFTTTGSDFTPVGPARILDTRHGTGTGGKIAPVGQGGVVAVKIAGANGIPADVTAVAMNVTLTDSSGSGNVAVTPTSGTPGTSNLNYTAGQTVANYVIAPVGPDGDVYLTKAGPGTVDLIADVAGYFTHTAASGYAPVPPRRILDTRTGTGAPQSRVVSGAAVKVQIAGVGGVPAGATAVALNLTLTNSTGFGNVLAYPDGGAQPNASSVDYTAAGQTVADYAVVPIGADGSIDLVKQGPGAVDLIADVDGYFSSLAPSVYVPVNPTRLIDTRWSGTGALAGAASATVAPPLNLVVTGSYPAVATALVVNATATQTTSAGYLALQSGDSTGVPTTSSVNWTGAGQTVPNLAIAAPDSNDALRIYNGGRGSTQYIIDLFGYFTEG
jgi:PKD repeat protein